MSIKDEVFLGTRERYDEKLKKLADMAQPEIWAFGKVKTEDPYRILRNYFQYTYDRLKEENKLITSSCGKYRAMNTGLLTKYNQEIIGVFTESKSAQKGKLPWYLLGCFKENDRLFNSYFSEIPKMANYCENPSDLIFDRNLEIRMNKDHIIDDNFTRFSTAGYTDTALILALLDAAKITLIKKLERNFKLALPFYYKNSETGENKIQLLAPLYFPASNVKLAIVLNKLTSSDKSYYEAVTVLPVEWAYMNARLIVRPDEEWAKILEEVDSELVLTI